MAKRSGARRDSEVMEFFRRGGKKIPAGFAGKALAATKTLRRRQMGAAQEMRIDRAKLFARLKDESAVAVDDPANKKTLEQIVGLHKKL
ncbi:MAG TPA: hypothetical protein VN901_02640, partial [Candidatus Acidoferrales bacterium]|nr:hypothetical protein [Candidatus Acidoferrales bacterium]